MALTLTYPEGATPLDPNEVEGLIPHEVVATVAQLNAFEQQNILGAIEWLEARPPRDVLDDRFLRELHRRMLSRTWTWAGRYRVTERNIGIAPDQIAVRVRDLTEDFKCQLDSKALPLDEVAARFHHRLVSIHPFANGNGRHARLATDLLLETHGGEAFTWGSQSLYENSAVRQRYIKALREADDNDFKPLFDFVRT